MKEIEPFRLPDDWSGREALAIFDLLDKLRQKIWLEYREEIITQVREEMDQTELDMENSEFEFDDDINF
jgi:hypothetical protein